MKYGLQLTAIYHAFIYNVNSRGNWVRDIGNSLYYLNTFHVNLKFLKNKIILKTLAMFSVFCPIVFI